MDHNEAITTMAVEQYLLNELSPEMRDAFEEHLFGCPQCASDLRAGAAFVREARAQLPAMVTTESLAGAPISGVKRPAHRKNWFSSLQAAFAVPAFAVLLMIVGYQNIATIPHLRARADRPRLLPWTAIHAGTRGAETTQLAMSRTAGAVLLIDILEDPSFTAYAFDLRSSDGRIIWTTTEAVRGSDSEGPGTFSLLIPGTGVKQGSYALVITGISAGGERTQIDRRMLEVHFQD